MFPERLTAFVVRKECSSCPSPSSFKALHFPASHMSPFPMQSSFQPYLAFLGVLIAFSNMERLYAVPRRNIFLQNPKRGAHPAQAQASPAWLMQTPPWLSGNGPQFGQLQETAEAWGSVLPFALRERRVEIVCVCWYCCRTTESFRLEEDLQDPRAQLQPTPLCPLPTSLSATSPLSGTPPGMGTPPLLGSCANAACRSPKGR